MARVSVKQEDLLWTFLVIYHFYVDFWPKLLIRTSLPYYKAYSTMFYLSSISNKYFYFAYKAMAILHIRSFLYCSLGWLYTKVSWSFFCYIFLLSPILLTHFFFCSSFLLWFTLQQWRYLFTKLAISLGSSLWNIVNYSCVRCEQNRDISWNFVTKEKKKGWLFYQKFASFFCFFTLSSAMWSIEILALYYRSVCLTSVF